MKLKITEQGNHKLLNLQDLPILLEFNKKPKNKEFKIQTELLPEPIIGNPETAKVILLALNPGFKDGEWGENYWHKDIEFRKLISDNIELKFSDYPYYYLNDDKRFENTPGHIWSKRIFKELINELNNNKCLSTKVCLIQYHGYHSKRYKNLGKILPSQEETFSLIRNAMTNKIPIVIMRSKKIWFNAIEGLEGYDEIIILNNPRNPTLSRGNMNEIYFKKLIHALK